MWPPGPATSWGGLSSQPPWLPSQSGRQRLPASGRRLLGQVETSPFKPALANQGLARPPVQTGDSGRPPAPASETPARGRVNLLPRLLGSNTGASGYRSGAAMEHSLHRVSFGSRRAHPGFSFCLATFGKCRLWPAAAGLLQPALTAQRGRPHGHR